MSKKMQIAALVAEGLNAREIADRVGVSRQYVWQVADAEGLVLTPAPRGQPPHPPRSPYRWGQKISPSWVGAAGELTAAVDLITRGYLVYHAVARTGPFDLIAYKGGAFYRVEVRTVRKREQGCQIKWDQVDLLAKVCPNGEVVWAPSAPD